MNYALPKTNSLNIIFLSNGCGYGSPNMTFLYYPWIKRKPSCLHHQASLLFNRCLLGSEEMEKKCFFQGHFGEKVSQRRDFELASPIHTFLTDNLFTPRAHTRRKHFLPPPPPALTVSHHGTWLFATSCPFFSLRSFSVFAKALSASSTTHKYKTVREATRCLSLSTLTAIRHCEDYVF